MGRPQPAFGGKRLARSFADKLTRLFEEVRGPGGRRWENREVVEAINASGKAKISASYLSELLSGKKDNPNIWTVKALADFFDQSVEYFVQDRAPATEHTSHQPLAGTTTLAERLELLFKMAHQPSNAQVAGIVGATVTGLDIDRLKRLRTGEATDISGDEVAGLAVYFKVPAAVITDPEVAELAAASLPAMALIGDETVRRIAFRARALSASDQAMVAGLLERLTGSDPGMSADDLDL